jgi:5S rRNA maturation endonuclease (ribonuclease M5)
MNDQARSRERAVVVDGRNDTSSLKAHPESDDSIPRRLQSGPTVA